MTIPGVPRKPMFWPSAYSRATGVGQVCEITTQLRGEAGERQHPGARTGLAHMVGVGAVCLVHVLRKD